MSDKKISELPIATVPLAGDELLPLVQVGVTKQVHVSDIKPANATETLAGIAEIATQAEVNAGTDDTSFVTPAKLASYVNGNVTGLWNDRGNFNASVNTYPSTGGSGTAGAILKGDIWTVSVAGTLPTGLAVEAGDTVRALTDSPGNTQANWAIAQNNIGFVPENVANKSISVITDQTSNIKYPSVKSVYDWATGLFATISNLALKLNLSGGTLTGLVQGAKSANIASATTTNLGAATGNYVHITGTTTITSLGTAAAGTMITVVFDGALILTYNATSLILPTAANITTVAKDTAIFESEGGGNWKCISYQRASGQNVLSFTPENLAKKNASGGYVGLTVFNINFRNVANTFTSFFTNSNTAARTYTFKNRNGIIADDTDLAAKQDTLVSGTNIKTIGGISLLGSGDIPFVSSVNQTQKIYVDAQLGTDAASPGRGNLDKPYATVEYVLANVTNTGTVTATTTNGSSTLTAVSSTASILVGQYITGTGIPYNTVVVSKTSNTIVLSQACTAAATITATWWTPYIVKMTGNFTVTSSIGKSGFWIDAREATINFGAIMLIDHSVNSLIPEYYWLGRTYGTHTSSRLFGSTTVSGITFKDVFINYGKYYSIGTATQLGGWLTTEISCINIKIEGDMLDARFGKVASLTPTNSWRWDGNTYGLLAGIAVNGTTLRSGSISGFHESPSSVVVFSSGLYCNSTANFIGSTIWNYYSTHIGRLSGSTHSVFYSNIFFTNRSAGIVTVAEGNCELHFGDSEGFTLNVNSGTTATLYGHCNANGTHAIAGSLINNGYINNGGSQLVITGTLLNNGNINGRIYFAANSTGKNFGNIISAIINTTGAGYLIENYGSMVLSTYGVLMAQDGTFINHGKIISNGSFTDNTAVVLLNSANAIFKNHGTIENLNNENTAIFTKTLGTLFIYPSSTFKVSNGKSPIRCTTDTSASKDVYIFGAINNCNGSTYGLSFAFDGSTYAPNDLVGGIIYENTAY